jgi:hypothetical protein
MNRARHKKKQKMQKSFGKEIVYNAGINGLYLVQLQDCTSDDDTTTLSRSCPPAHNPQLLGSAIQCRLCYKSTNGCALQSATFRPDRNIRTGRDKYKQAR